MCLSHWMWGCGSLNTRQTNATSLPTTAVWLAGRPACRMGLCGERSGTARGYQQGALYNLKSTMVWVGGFSYQLHPGCRYAADSHIHSPQHRCSSLYQMGPPTPLLESTCGLGSEKKHLKLKQLFGCLLVSRKRHEHTLKPPILWSFLNSFPFLYQRREGTGFPIAWHRNFTVLLAGTAWSCFSIFSGITHWGANAGKWGQHYDCIHFCLRLIFIPTQKWRKKETAEEEVGLRWSFSLLADSSLDSLFSSEDDSSSSSSSEDFTASPTTEVRYLKTVEEAVLMCANRTEDLLTGSLRCSLPQT